jgi:hypothetical protein
LPLDAVGDDVQEPLAVGHVVGVAGLDRFPGVAGRVGCRKPERAGEPGPAVRPVVGEGFAGPFAGDQDAASGVAEVFAAVGFALAGPGSQARPGVLGLDAVAEPVRAGWRARLVPECVGESFGVVGLGAGVCVVAVAEVLGQVFGEVADATAGVPSATFLKGCI